MKQIVKRFFVLMAVLLPLAMMAQNYTSVPYFQNFDSYSTGSNPTGWWAVQTGMNGGTTFPCCYNHAPNSRNNSGVYYEFEFSSSSSVRTEIAATCEFANISNLMVTFYLATQTSYAPDLFEVGVVEADSTFVPMDTISVTAASSGWPYYQYRVYFAEYTGSGTRIGFRASRNSGQMTLFMEDVEVANAPSCAFMPGSVSVAAVDSNSASLTWGAPSTSAGYFVYFNNDSTWYNTSTNSISFTGLSANTPYTGYIYNTCDGSDTSEAVAFSFRTACGWTELPLVMGFEGEGTEFPSCWNKSEIRNTYPSISSSYAHTGTYGCGLYSTSAHVSIATPYMYRPINSLETKFWIRKSSTSYTASMAVGYVTDVNNAANSTVWVDTIDVPYNWEEFEVSFRNITESDTGYIVYRKISGGSATVYIDDILVREARSCANPSNLRQTGTAHAQVNLAWDDSEASAWQVAYGPVGFDPDTVVYNMVSFYADTVTVNGLEDSLTYEFYVRADCGSEQSYWVGPVSARPNLYIMTANTTDTVYMCGGTIVDDGGLNGDFSTYQTSYLIVYPNDNTQRVTLTGTATTMGTYSYGTNTLELYEGVGTNGRLLGSYSNTTNQPVNVTSDEGPITIKFTSSYYAGPGYELLVSCTDLPSCNDPYDVEITDIAGGSATVNWSYGTATTPAFFTIAVTDTAANVTNTYTAADSARSFMLSGLDQTTVYYVTVAANCGASDMSNEVGAYFMTKCFVGGDMQVGEGNVSLSTHPFQTYYNYSICQAIYDQDEVAGLDTVYGIKVNRISGPSNACNISIYIDTTSRTTFSGGSDFLVMDSSKLYYSGSYTFVNGWNEISFTHPWVRPSATANIVVTFDNNTGSYTSTSYWQGTGSLTGKTLYQYSDGTNVDPTVANSSTSTTSNRPNVTFLGPCGDANCVAPSVTVASTTANTVTLNWVPGMSEYTWTVEYKMASDTTWNVAVASTTAQTATITGLYANTMYNFRVGSLCLVSTEVPYSYISARTACSTMSRSSLPLTENFDTYSTGAMPNCWVRTLTGTSGSGTFPSCYNYSSNARSGNVYFEMESSNGNTEIFGLPAIDTIDGLAVEFYIATSSSYVTTFELGVLENDDSFTVLDTIDLSNCSGLYNYVKKNLRINYSGNGERIAFRASKSSGQMTVFLDDFTVYVPNPCDSVHNLHVDSTTTSTISISWVDTNNVGSYTVKVGTTNNAAAAATVATVTGNNYTITGLTSATKYYIFVYTNCLNGQSDVNMVSAKTNCDAITTFPWSEDFENFTGSSTMGSEFEQCWYRYTTPSSYSAFPYRYNYYNHTAGGSNCMYFYEYYDSYMALPEMNNLDTLVLKFYMMGSSTSYNTYRVEVGVMSDQENPATFVPIDTVTFTGADYEWERHAVGLSGAPDSCHFIAFRTISGGYTSYYIDDISVNYNNGCTDPINFNVPAVGMSTATISWTDTSSSNNYLVKISTTSNEADAFDTINVFTNSCTFTGLSALTTYHVWIYNNCVNGLSDVLTGDFSTLGADPHFLPYFNDFEDTTDVFTVYQVSGSNSWYTGSAVSYGGNNAMYVSNDNGLTNAYTNTNQSISFAMTYLQIPYDSSYAISYNWRCQGEGTYDLMRIALVPEDYDFSTAFTAINRYSNTLPAGWVALDGGKKNLRNTWQFAERSMNLNAGNYYLTIVWINDGAMGSNPPAAIDNLSIELITCPAPQNLTASSSSSTTIDVAWSAGAANSWIVEYGVHGFVRGTGITRVVSASNTSLTGLAPTTEYDIYVRSICGEGDTGFVSGTSCVTSCDSVITNFPWVEDFEHGLTCWYQTYVTGDVSWTYGRGGNAYGGLTGAASGEYNARFSSNSYTPYVTNLITPVLDILSEDDVMMTFFHAQPAWGTDQDTMSVHYRVHPDSAWHYLASWNGNITYWQADTIMLPRPSSTYQVAFRAHSGFGLGILLDSVVVYGSESCTRPVISSTNIGATSIDITWGSPANEFDVAIRSINQNWPEPTRVNTHAYSFTNLEPNTRYEYRVRSICSDTSESFWTTVNSLTDTQTCYTVQGVELDEVTLQSVTLSWTPDASGHSVAYVVNVSNSIVNLFDTVYTNHATVEGLNPEMTYTASVQAMCSATTYSDWSESIVFTTTACTSVSDVSVSDVTAHGVVVDWTPGEDQDTWVVSYGFIGFTQNEGTSITVTSHPVTITGLLDDMQYDVYVRTVCADEIYSNWSSVVRFTTPEAVGIEEVVEGNVSCTIYPNPTSDATTISVGGVNGKVQIAIVDMNGRTVASENLNCEGDCVKQMNVDGLAQGAYFVRIVGTDVNIVRKLVVR
ncbi:MAG: fibronectin type III domain-containing protein [Bacteroidales bacterium]|nr:fibronectin type III domain-containing protein [Bacteroidales bacterium]